MAFHYPERRTALQGQQKSAYRGSDAAVEHLAHVDAPLFEGLDAVALHDVRSRMRLRQFDARAAICRQGEPGKSFFVIQRGLAQVLGGRPGSPRCVARLGRGEVVGEPASLTGEPHSATVIASVPTEVLELSQDDFSAMALRHPALLANLCRILSRRLARWNLQPAEGGRGDAVALVTGRPGAALAAGVVAATKAASPRRVAALDVAGVLPPGDVELTKPTAEDTLAVLDHLLASHGTVVVVASADQADLPVLVEHMGRATLLTTEPETRRLAAPLGPVAACVDVVILDTEARRAPFVVDGLRVARVLDLEVPSRDIAWLGRHLSRTKLGLALGAGGAKGYAHVAALRVLEEAGYTVDYVAGSSIGAMVGAWLALGMRAAEVETVMRNAFDPGNVAAIFKLSMAGTSTGLEVLTRMCRETTRGRSFEELQIPFVAMAVDLDIGRPAPINEGPLWQALLASTALPGLFPPFRCGQQRLIDGLALVPVPTGAVIEAGADVTVSVNLMGRETLPAWPGQSCPASPPPARAGSRMLDTLLEAMDVAQRDASTRHAALADVTVTPRFGPGTWRDFHLADLFLTAGRLAAEEQIALLRGLARPQLA
jgi:predicted acylesterase/phospholipase RssA